MTTAKISASGAAAGQAIVFDGANVVYGNPLAGALALPAVQSASDAGTLLSLTNTGPGGAGSFAINNADSNSPALTVATNGTGLAISATGAISTNRWYSIGGQRVLSIPGDGNTFAGVGAGNANTTGNSNAFFGQDAGLSNTAGIANAFFGNNAGRSNTTGGRNAFFGALAGILNTTGSNNAFFGEASGYNNETGLSNAFFGAFAGFNNSWGSDNAFFGTSAGYKNKTANQNAFFGISAGYNNATGQENAFFGYVAGYNNTTGGINAFFGNSAGQTNGEGSGNAFFGAYAGPNNSAGSGNTFLGLVAGESNTDENNNTFVGSHSNGAAGITGATAVGANAVVTQSNSLVLGSINGVGDATADVNVGVGTTAPKAKLHVAGGKIYVEADGQGVILKSPDGTCYEITVANGGALTTAPVTCPM